jgi:FemAB-related protein (PEP-CTERM system-associated)
MRVVCAKDDTDGRRWEQFVGSSPASTCYHRWNWKRVIEQGFGWPTYYLMAEDGEGRLAGVLPLVWQKSLLFGSFLTSLPFLNAGGILSISKEADESLLEEAIQIARRIGAASIEFRHRDLHHLGLPVKNNKVTMVLPIHHDSELTWKALDTKVRTKVRKACSYGMSVEFGVAEYLDDFYTVFAHNMRELGTPVYSRKIFAEILTAFPEDTFLCRIRYGNKVVAASFLCGFRERIEAVWSSSLRTHFHLKPNMFLYWNLLSHFGSKGFRLFDFGRSSVGSGTYLFKQQWGAQPVPLYWDTWLACGHGKLPERSPENPRYKCAIRVWQKLPLALTKLIGPRVVRCLP